MEQQYTCPKCFKNYTKYSIQEHYDCGVEPLGIVASEEHKSAQAELNEATKNLMDAATKPEPKKRGRRPKEKLD